MVDWYLALQCSINIHVGRDTTFRIAIQQISLFLGSLHEKWREEVGIYCMRFWRPKILVLAPSLVKLYHYFLGSSDVGNNFVSYVISRKFVPYLILHCTVGYYLVLFSWKILIRF